MNTPHQRETEPHTKVISFWSEGKIAESAFKQITKHQSQKHKAEADAMLSEWILD